MEKFLKVCNLPQGKGHAPGINLKGKYLSEYGFDLGDMVNVSISNNQIVIKKITPQTMFEELKKQNKYFTRLADELGLEVV